MGSWAREFLAALGEFVNRRQIRRARGDNEIKSHTNIKHDDNEETHCELYYYYYYYYYFCYYYY